MEWWNISGALEVNKSTKLQAQDRHIKATWDYFKIKIPGSFHESNLAGVSVGLTSLWEISGIINSQREKGVLRLTVLEISSMVGSFLCILWWGHMSEWEWGAGGVCSLIIQEAKEGWRKESGPKVLSQCLSVGSTFQSFQCFPPAPQTGKQFLTGDINVSHRAYSRGRGSYRSLTWEQL